MADLSTTAPLSFAELIDVHDELQQSSPFFANMDLPQFSRFMQEQTGTSLFDQGLKDSRIKRASVALDKFLGPIGQPLGRVARSAAEGVGLGEYGDLIQRLGEETPRATAELVSTIAGLGLLAAPDPTLTSKIAGAGLLGLGTGSAASKTFTETGSALAGLVSGGSLAAVPAAARLGRSLIGTPLVNKFLMKPTVQALGKAGPTVTTFAPRITTATHGSLASEAAKVAERGFEFLGENVGVVALNEAAGQAASLAAGQGGYNPFTVEHAVELAAGLAPFSAIDAAMHLHGRLTKGFSSVTGRENASYLGQVRAAQQLADTADLINRYRTTMKRTEHPLLEWPYGPEVGPQQPRPTPFPSDRPITPPPTIIKRPLGQTLSSVELQLSEAENFRTRNINEVQRLFDDGIISETEAYERLKRINELPQDQLLYPPVVDNRMTTAEKAEAADLALLEANVLAIRGGESTGHTSRRPTASKYAGMIGAKEWFTTYFRLAGHSEQAVTRYADMAETISAAFTDVGRTRIIDLLSENKYYGVAYPGRTKGTGVVGLDPDLVLDYKDLQSYSLFGALKTLGHEYWHRVEQDAVKGLLEPTMNSQVNNFRAFAAGLTPEEREMMLTSTFGMMIPNRLRGIPRIQNVIVDRVSQGKSTLGGTTLGHTAEFTADMSGLYMLGALFPDNVSRVKYIADELKFSSALETQFAKAMYVPLRDIMFAVKDYATQWSSVDPQGAGKWHKMASNIGTYIQHVETILKGLKEVDVAKEALNRIRLHEPEFFEKLKMDSYLKTTRIQPFEADRMGVIASPDATIAPSFKKAVEEASKLLGLSRHAEMEKELGARPRFFETWYPFAQLSATYPQLLGVYNIVRSYSAMANDFLVDLFAPMLGKPNRFGRITIDSEAKGLKKIASTKEELDALRDVTLISNEVSKAEKRRLTDGEIDGILSTRLRGEAKARVADFFKTLVENIYPKAADIQVIAAADKVSRAASALLMLENPSLKWKDAKLFGTWLRDSVIDAGNPVKATEAAAKAQRVLAAVGPVAVAKARSMIDEMLPAVQKLEALFRENPGYSPETSLGQFLVLWRRDKKSNVWGRFASDKFEEAKAKLDKVRAEGAEVAFMKDKNDMRGATAGIDPDLAERWATIERSAMNAAIRALGEGSEDMKKFRQMYSPGDTIITEVKSRGINQFLLPRSLREGREEINPVLNFLNYVSGVAHGVAKGYTREEAGLAFMDQELRQNPQLLDLARKHLDNVINPTAKELSLLKKINFTYFLGFNFSSMLIEGSQGVMTFVPQITRDTGSIAAGYHYWGGAVKQVVQGLLSKDKKLVDKETQTALDRAVKEGRVDAGVMQEFNMLEEDLVPNLRALAAGDSKLLQAGELVKKPLYWYLHASRWLYSFAPRANSHVAFVAAYDVAKKRLGLKGEQAYEYATTTVDRTMFGGGKAGRPVYPFAGVDKLQGVVGLMYSLQTYTFSTIAMMARLAKDSITKSDRLTPEQKKAARKAFGQMMVTQVAFGGALSLPFASGILAVIDQLFPEAEARKKTNEAFHSLLDDPDGLGSSLADIALKGLPDAAGLDLSSRVGLSSLLGVNPYSGFQVGNLVGPVGSVVENVFRSARSATIGDFEQATRTLLPTPYKNVLQLAIDSGQIKDLQGRLLYEPGHVEQGLLALGFRPSAVTHRQEAAQLIAQGEEVERIRLNQFHREQVDLLLNGQTGVVRENLLNFQKSNNLYDARAGARRVVELAQAATVPYDPARTGARTTAQDRQRVASMLGLAPGPTEMQLLQQRKSLERTLRIPGAGVLTRSEVVLARTTDYLMSLDPNLSRQEARLRAEHMLGRGSLGL